MDFRISSLGLEVLLYYLPSGNRMLSWFCRTNNFEHPMTCSLCDKKISFVRSLTGSRYCCDEHQKEETAKLRQTAIQRLRNTPAFHQLEQAQLVITDLRDAGAASNSTPAGAGLTVNEFEPASA